MDGVVDIFEAIGDLETVLTRLRDVAPELVAEFDQLQHIQDGLIDDSLDRGDDIALDGALESTENDSSLSESDVDEDSQLALDQTAANEVDAAGWLGKQVWKKIFKRMMNKRKKYICATRPQRHRTRKGKQIWYSMVKYKRPDGSLGQLFRVVGRDPNHKPQAVTMQGIHLRWC